MMPSPTVMPTVMPTTSPGVLTPMTTAPGTTGAAITTLDEATKASKDIAAELEKLSEVSKAYVAVAGDTAVIGLTFDTQYQGGLTTRITSMVTDRVGTVNNGIKNIGVTVQAAQVKSIQDLMATMEKTGTTFTTVKTQVDALYKTITANTGTPTATP